MFTENSIRTDFIGKLEYENFLKDIQLFLLFKHFRYKLNPKSSLDEKDVSLAALYKKFNDTETEYWELGKTYHLGSRKVFPCFSKQSKASLY